MKAVDTGVLLALLQGSTKARDAVRRLRGVELATTEANMLELTILAASAPQRDRKGRIEALERLRQRLTVLPLDPRATREGSRRGAGLARPVMPHVLGMLGALEAAGCEELVTDDRGIAGDRWGFRVRVLPLSTTP